MLVLLAAAAVAASPPPVPRAERMPNLYNPPARCGALHEEVTRRIRTSTPRASGLKQYAVLRQVGGCGVPTPMGYHPDYLLPGNADAPQYRPVSDKPR
jgi:hypothetical protein